MNLRNFDLNLLVAFDALMRECNVSRAAEKMFVSQSAMSHSLNRLRQLIDDPLLVRTSGGMKPTARALSLVEPVRKALQDIEQCIHSPLTFDPKLSHRRFVIAGNDYVEYLVVPPLVDQIREHASGVDLHVNQPDVVLPEDEIENGDFDLVLGFQVILRPPPYLRAEALFQDHMACVVRAYIPR
jgi:DNA-binding transcriptional LysR family regulator